MKWGFLFQNNPKDLDLFHKTGLDLCDFLEEKKASYDQRNPVCLISRSCVPCDKFGTLLVLVISFTD